MNNPSNNLRLRKDLSPYLFHFTKGCNPKDIIQTIVDEMKLKSNTGYICFTEQPLIMCDEMLTYMQRFKKPMYQPYGIGIKRDVLYKMGARNLIYGSYDEYLQLPPCWHWRFDILDVDNYDFSWLREWRYPGGELDLKSLNPNDIIIITPTGEDEIIAFSPDYDVDFVYESDDKQAHPYVYQTGASRVWRSINFDRIRKHEMSDYMIDASTFFEQKLGEDYEYSIIQ